MNYYGSPEHAAELRDKDLRVFSRCDFSKPAAEYSPGDGYIVRSYGAAVELGSNGAPYRIVDAGQISRLYRDDELVFEWKFVGFSPREATVIDHANGGRYLLYYEELYGYSVLDLASGQSAHYIPQESHETDMARFRETVIWCAPHYDADSSLLAVEGCIWAAPGTVIVVDFSDPMRIVEAARWLDLGDPELCEELDFVEWTSDSLVCDAGVFGKADLIKRARGEE